MISTRQLSRLAKPLVSVGLILWILRDADLASILRHIGAADPRLLVLAFSMFFVGYLITAVRWRMLLAAQGVEVPVRRLVASYMVALFFNNFLPSTIGGDLMRMYDTWRYGSGRSVAVSVILVDRFSGISALLVYAAGAALLVPTIGERLPLLAPLLTLAVASAAALTWLIYGNRRVPMAWLGRVLRGPLVPLRRLVDKAAAAFAAYRGRADVLAATMALSLLLQLNVIVHFIVLTRALGVEIPAAALFALVPVAVFIMILPISINAIGVREAVFVFLFALYGIDAERAIAFAWVAFGFALLQGVLGGILFALRRLPAKRGGAAGADD